MAARLRSPRSSDNLADNDNDSYRNVYVRDLSAQTTTLVSLPTGAVGTGNNGDSQEPSISADGRLVAFQSASDNVAVNDNNDFDNAYVRDLAAQTTTLVGLPTGTDGSANDAHAVDPTLSPDGRFVAFNSSSSNLAANDADGVRNIYVRDLAAQTTMLASLPTGTDGSANNDHSYRPDMSTDGRYVAFQSGSDNLADNDNNDLSNIYVRTLLPDPPRNVEAPAVTGQAAVGQTLACSDGLWTEGTLGRVWRRDGQPIAGQTAASYLLVAADGGYSIDCLVTATNADGATNAKSNAVTPAPIPPVPSPRADPPIRALKLAINLITRRTTTKPRSRVSFRIESNMPGKATLKIRKGRKTVATIKATLKQAGRYTIKWNGRTGTSNSGKKAKRRSKALKPGKYTTRLTFSATDKTRATKSGRLTIKRRR